MFGGVGEWEVLFNLHTIYTFGLLRLDLLHIVVGIDTQELRSLRASLPSGQHTMPSLKVLLTSLLAFTSTTWALPHSILQTRGNDNAIAAAAPPRLVAYIQTFRSVDGGPLSLLPLLNENTGVTHILLSAVHLNEQPGDITLNEHHPNDTMYDTLWSEVKQLQAGGIKVMMMLGGAARGTFERLSGDDASVSIKRITNIPFKT
jgi:hypothetical protein